MFANRIKAVITLFAVTLVSAGCGQRPHVTGMALGNPGDQLTRAVAASAGQSFTFTLGDGRYTFNGVYDSADKGVRLTGESGEKLVTIDKDMWVLDSPGTVLHYDMMGFTVGDPLVILTDATFALPLLRTALGVKSSGPGAYTGVVVLQHVAETNEVSAHLAAVMGQEMGHGIATLRFAAEVDGERRLAAFSVKLPYIDDGKDSAYLFKITAFGPVEPVTKPAGTIIEAPSDAYHGN